MSATQSGVTYDLRLNAPALDADLGQAEARITSSVQKMNALRVVIPVSLDLSAFNAQAAQVNSTLAGWQNGITVGGAGGGIGGGGAGGNFSATQNNLNLTAIQNNLSAVQNIQQNFTQINQVAEEAATAAGRAANSVGGIAGNLRALHRGLYTLVAITQGAESLIGLGNAVYANQFGTAAQAGAAVKTAQQDIRSIPIVGPIIGGVFGAFVYQLMWKS